MPKPQDIFQLAQQEAVRVTASPQAWQSFLYTAAHNYHTTYLNQLLIHAQRPDAAACASMEYWNKQANRLVMRGSRSITVLQRRQGVAVTKPVFAIGDTTLLSQTPTGGPWEVTDTTRPLLLQDKSDDWLTALAQDGVSNDADRARRMLERNVADSTLQWAQSDEQMQLLQALVTQSAVYMARLRIGLPVQDEDYPALQSVSQFDTCQISLCLGGYVQAAAEPMLNAIGREALRLNRDSIAIPHEPVHNESTPTQLNSREEAVTYDVHEEPRRLPDSEPFPAEPAEPVPEPLREAAPGISGAERADALRPADAGGHAADELQSNRTDSTADGGQDPARADADHPDAGPQDEPAGLGTCANKPTEMWVSKRDLTNDEELPGATLIIKDAKDNIVDTWVSTDTPHRVTGLHFDEEYTLTEKRPADGYAVADDIVFRLERKTDADGHELDEADVYYLKDKKKLWFIPWEEWELLDDATVIMRDDITKVQISKVDIATDKELPGAELVIKDKDGNTVAQWVSEDKPHYIERLPAGDYTLTEITAPNGYQLAESIAFTVLPTGELQTVVMKDARIPEETPHEDTPSNTPQPTPGSTPAPSPAPASTPTATPTPMPVIPQTGDVFPFALLSAAVFGSIVGFGILAYKRRKSKMDESEH